MATLEELKAEIRALLIQLETISGESLFPNNSSSENERIERYLSEFTQREGLLLTIASLFTLLPFVEDGRSVQYFLVWVIPILIFAIVMYMLSTKRINFLSKSDRSIDHQSLNNLLKQRYYSSLKYHRLTDASSVSYFFAFIANYYLYSFISLPSILISVQILVVAILIGILRYRLVNKVTIDEHENEKITLGGVNTLAVGSAPPEE